MTLGFESKDPIEQKLKDQIVMGITRKIHKQANRYLLLESWRVI